MNDAEAFLGAIIMLCLVVVYIAYLVNVYYIETFYFKTTYGICMRMCYRGILSGNSADVIKTTNDQMLSCFDSCQKYGEK